MHSNKNRIANIKGPLASLDEATTLLKILSRAPIDDVVMNNMPQVLGWVAYSMSNDIELLTDAVGAIERGQICGPQIRGVRGSGSLRSRIAQGLCCWEPCSGPVRPLHQFRGALPAGEPSLASGSPVAALLARAVC